MFKKPFTKATVFPLSVRWASPGLPPVVELVPHEVALGGHVPEVPVDQRPLAVLEVARKLNL